MYYDKDFTVFSSLGLWYIYQDYRLRIKDLPEWAEVRLREVKEAHKAWQEQNVLTRYLKGDPK